MKRVYLIRHALPALPGGKRTCLGRTDLPLCAEGLAQAKEMAARLPPVCAVFSSPLSRAVQTAQAICPDVTVLPGLRELDAGDWDGLTFDEIRLQYPELYAARGENPRLLPPNAEAEAPALARFSAAMAQAAIDSPGDFAVVTHGGILTLFLTSLGLPRRKPDYAEIIPLAWENGTFSPAPFY
ncbi:MAG: histidine phosphatase family protein [Faecousia sp.]